MTATHDALNDREAHTTNVPTQGMRDAARKLERLGNNSQDLWTVAAQFEKAVADLPDYDEYLTDSPVALTRTYTREQLIEAARRMRSIASTAAFEARQYVSTLEFAAERHDSNGIAAG